MSKIVLKKLVKQLSEIKGRHTELVTVYVPVGYSLHEISNQLRSEQSTAENIKSKSVRKNVVTALEKICRHLQLYKKTPDNGLALFCGNVSEREGVNDIELWAIEPSEPIKVKMYWCDQRFVTDPLQDMVKEKEIYGIINLDKSDGDIALLRGKKIEPIVHFESIVPGKTRAGGQSSARFARVREGLLNDWLKKIGEAANKIFEEHPEVIGILLSGPGPIKEMFFKEDYLHADVKNKILGTVDTGYTGETGLHETLERGEDLIKEAGVIKEKKLLQKFFNELQKPAGLVSYGIKEVINALELGAVDTIIVSEGLIMSEVEYECECGMQKRFVTPEKKKEQKCDTCGKPLGIIGEKDVIEALEERVKNYGSKLDLVSADTREGSQFLELGGVGAFLRYNI
jgi:peptide chain release factor subunit 1